MSNPPSPMEEYMRRAGAAPPSSPGNASKGSGDPSNRSYSTADVGASPVGGSVNPHGVSLPNSPLSPFSDRGITAGDAAEEIDEERALNVYRTPVTEEDNRVREEIRAQLNETTLESFADFRPERWQQQVAERVVTDNATLLEQHDKVIWPTLLQEWQPAEVLNICEKALANIQRHVFQDSLPEDLADRLTKHLVNLEEDLKASTARAVSAIHRTHRLALRATDKATERGLEKAKKELDSSLTVLLANEEIRRANAEALSGKLKSALESADRELTQTREERNHYQTIYDAARSTFNEQDVRFFDLETDLQQEKDLRVKEVTGLKESLEALQQDTRKQIGDRNKQIRNLLKLCEANNIDPNSDGLTAIEIAETRERAGLNKGRDVKPGRDSLYDDDIIDAVSGERIANLETELALAKDELSELRAERIAERAAAGRLRSRTLSRFPTFDLTGNELPLTEDKSVEGRDRSLSIAREDFGMATKQERRIVELEKKLKAEEEKVKKLGGANPRSESAKSDPVEKKRAELVVTEKRLEEEKVALKSKKRAVDDWEEKVKDARAHREDLEDEGRGYRQGILETPEEERGAIQNAQERLLAISNELDMLAIPRVNSCEKALKESKADFEAAQKTVQLLESGVDGRKAEIAALEGKQFRTLNKEEKAEYASLEKENKRLRSLNAQYLEDCEAAWAEHEEARLILEGFRETSATNNKMADDFKNYRRRYERELKEVNSHLRVLGRKPLASLEAGEQDFYSLLDELRACAQYVWALICIQPHNAALLISWIISYLVAQVGYLLYIQCYPIARLFHRLRHGAEPAPEPSDRAAPALALSIPSPKPASPRPASPTPEAPTDPSAQPSEAAKPGLSSALKAQILALPSRLPDRPPFLQPSRFPAAAAPGAIVFIWIIWYWLAFLAVRRERQLWLDANGRGRRAYMVDLRRRQDWYGRNPDSWFSFVDYRFTWDVFWSGIDVVQYLVWWWIYRGGMGKLAVTWALVAGVLGSVRQWISDSCMSLVLRYAELKLLWQIVEGLVVIIAPVVAGLVYADMLVGLRGRMRATWRAMW